MENAARSQGFKRRRTITLDDERDFESNTLTPYVFDPHVLEQLLVRWFARANISLRMIECEEFRAIITFLNNQVTEWCLTSYKTLETWITRTFEEEFETQRNALHRARSKINIWCDCWTSSSNRSLMGIGARYMGERGKMKNVLLGLKPISGSHTGKKLAFIMLDVVEAWGFAINLGYFVMDNASNNGRMMIKLEISEYIPPYPQSDMCKH